MAQTESRIRILFDGDARGVTAAAGQARAAISGLTGDSSRLVKVADRTGSGLLSMSKGMAALGAASSGASAAIGAALPALGALGLGFGVARAAMNGTSDALDAYSKALEEGKGDFSEYEKLLGRMAPAQAEFTRQLAAMKAPLSDLQKTAASAFLPGVTKMLRDSADLFPIFDAAVERTGRILSDTASQLGDLFQTEQFQADLDTYLRSTDAVNSALGDSFVALTERLVGFGAEMAPAAEGLATFIRDAEAGISGFLDGLAPHAEDFKSIFESLGSILRDVLPLVGELAGDLAAELAPILRDVAGFIRDNKDAISDWIPTLAAGAVAIGGLKIALQVKGWVDSALGALRLLGGVDVGEMGRKGGISWGKGFVGGLGLAGIGVGATLLLDQVLPKDAAKTYGSQAARDMLGEMAATFSGEQGDIFKTWDVARWISSPISLAVEVGKRTLLGITSVKPSPLSLEVSADKAYETVGGWTRATEGTVGMAALDANKALADGKVGEWVGGVSRARGTATLDANPGLANAQLGGWTGRAGAATGTAKLNANPQQANATTTGWQGAANRAVGTARLEANDRGARGTLSGLLQDWGSRVLTWTVRTITGFSGGGPVPGRATGGPIYGPGTGTSDTAGLFALSRGEHVLTAAEVRAAGGHGAIFAMRRELAAGRIPRMSTASRGRLATGGPVTPAAALKLPTPQVDVRLFVDGEQFRGMVRTEIDASNRDVARRVGAGAGTSY